MYKRICVPIDATRDSEQALPLAVKIAKRANCPIDLVSSIIPPALGTELYATPPSLDMMLELRQRTMERLSRIAHSLEEQGVHVSFEVLDGAVSYAIAEYVEATRTDLIVMTTHDRNRLERLLLGSVAKSVVRHVHVPVMLVHLKNGVATVPEEIRQIVVPLDGSPFSEQVLPHAAHLAAAMKAEIVVLTVFSPVVVGLPAAVPATALLAEAAQPEEAETKRALRSLLDDAAERLRAAGASAHTALVTSADPAHGIVEYAEEHQTDVIAMTTHGRGGVKRLVAGSVAEKVLRSSRQPTMLYRPRFD